MRNKKEDNLILDPDPNANLVCPKCGSLKWVKDGTTHTYVLKTYKCLDCNHHWIMFGKEIKESVEKFNE